MNQQTPVTTEARTFMEESASLFKIPAFLILAALALLVLGAATWVTGDLLDRVLTAFSTSAAAKLESGLAANFRHLIAAGLWLLGIVLALGLVEACGAPGSSRAARWTRGVLAAALLALFVAWPSVYGLTPLAIPLAVIAAAGVVHVFRATHIPTMALRELGSLLLNPLGYVVFTVFTVVLALLFVGALKQLDAASATSYLNIAPLTAFFGAADADSRETNFLVIALLLIVPVITMRLIAEERRAGTEEVLLTAPVREWHVVVGKFAGTFLFWLLMWCFALVPLHFLGQIGTLDPGQVLSSLFGMAVIGFGLLGLGVFGSAITRNQLAAAVITFLGMLLFTFQSFVSLPDAGGDWAWLRTTALYLDLRVHLAWVARGTIDSRTLFLFLSLGIFMLFLSVRALETRRWAGFSLRAKLTPPRIAGGIVGLLAIVAVLFAIAVVTGRDQVARAEAARDAQLAAKQSAEAEAGARPGAGAKGVFEETATEIEAPGEIKAGEAAPEAADEAPDEAPDEAATATKAAATDKECTEQHEHGPECEHAPEAKQAADNAAAPAAGAATKPSIAPQAADEPITARWTPRRILWLVGAGLILLMIYLAVFARWLSGGWHNQVVFGSNVIVGGLAALTLVVLANYLATRNHKADDWTRGRIHTLSPVVFEAVNGVLAEGESVEVVALVGRYARPKKRDEIEDNVRRDALEQIFAKFAEALNRPGVARFRYRFVDPKTDSEQLKQLVSEFNASGRRDVVVRYRNRHEILPDRTLFSMERDPARFREFLEWWRNRLRQSGMAPPIPDTEAEQFRVAELWLKGMDYDLDELRSVRARPEIERTLADTIIQLVQSPGNNLYFTVGHGEKKLDIQRKAADLQRNFGEAWAFRQTLLRENFDLMPLAPLTGDREIPKRCRYLLIAGPTKPFAAAELDKIERFVEGGGNLIVFTEAAHDSNLNPLLRKFGVEVEKAQIWLGRAASPQGMRMGTGHLQPMYEYFPILQFSDRHPISSALAEISTASDSGAQRSVRDYPVMIMLLGSPLRILRGAEVKQAEREALSRWRVTPVLECGPLGPPGPQMLIPYAETDLDSMRPSKDRKEEMGPFAVAVIAESADEADAAKRGKVLVVGDTDFIEDRLQHPEGWPPSRQQVSTYGVYDNKVFVQKAMAYLKQRPSVIEGEIARPIPYAGRFDQPVVSRARWTLWLAAPAFCLFLGLFVFITRRRA